MFYVDLERRRQIVREFIRNKPTTTYRDLRIIGIKVDKVYRGKMAEAFRDAGVKPPRTFKVKTKGEKRKILIDFVRKNPKAGLHIISKQTKINYQSVFNNVRELFNAARIPYPREEYKKLMERRTEERKQQIIDMVRKNPLVSVAEITKTVKAHPYQIFRNMEEIYKCAGTHFVKGPEKWSQKKIKQVIGFIKNNPLATQREINSSCRTHVQNLFKNGIFEAYEKSGVKFPYERLRLYGVSTKSIKRRARDFEDVISNKLSGYGKVSRLVKTKRGFADVVLERKGKKVVVEIKDYRAKDISISQIKQLNKYLEDFDCNLGILICHKKPRKDRFLMGKNRIHIIEKSELNQIPFIMGI